MSIGQIKSFNGVAVEIIAIDSNPRCAVMVVEVANRDNSHFVSRKELKA